MLGLDDVVALDGRLLLERRGDVVLPALLVLVETTLIVERPKLKL